MIDPEFLSLLRCPETRQRLKMADAALTQSLNEKIASGTLRNHGGEQIGTLCDGGLITEDGRRFYPIRDGIPSMLIAESFKL